MLSQASLRGGTFSCIQPTRGPRATLLGDLFVSYVDVKLLIVLKFKLLEDDISTRVLWFNSLYLPYLPFKFLCVGAPIEWQLRWLTCEERMLDQGGSTWSPGKLLCDHPKFLLGPT